MNRRPFAEGRCIVTHEKKRMLVDEKCVELAAHFLSDISASKPEDVTELAEILQACCEDFTASMEGKHSG